MDAEGSERMRPDNHERRVDDLFVSNVAAVQSFNEVADVLRSARDAGQVVIPWGSGTMMGLGNTPIGADVALDLTALNQVISYEPDDMTISAQVGCRIGDLNRLLGENGQMLPFDAAVPDEATIGGLYCTAVSGPRRFGYGSMRDLIIGISAMSPDGVISRGGGMVVKNVSGYDMMRLHYGALGSLGVVLQLNFKVLPAPHAVRTVVLRMPNAADAVKAVMAVRESPLLPTAMMVLDQSALSRTQLISAPWNVLLRAEGPENSADRQAERLIEAVESAVGDHEICADESSSEIWDAVNRSLSTQAPDSSIRIRIGVAPSDAERVIGELRSLGDSGSISSSISADMGNGLIIATFDAQNDHSNDLRTIWLAAKDLGRHATLLSGPSDVKVNTDVFGNEPAGFPLMRALKQQFDPSGVLNRGRFIGHL